MAKKFFFAAIFIMAAIFFSAKLAEKKGEQLKAAHTAAAAKELRAAGINPDKFFK